MFDREAARWRPRTRNRSFIAISSLRTSLHAKAPDCVQVKVLDFGISKIVDGGEGNFTRTGDAVGLPAYMSPEQVKGRLDIDVRTDLWSFGILLFECLTGRLPFHADTAFAVAADIVHGDIPTLERRFTRSSARSLQPVSSATQRSV